ncbi:hypothetical protein [Rhodocyclus tenuis]|uniref:hypothetical protein n=1 Tax=Rhodocyclus tenuis TaxID=1066 RepID=UPI001904779B|nr:hypothetical protein [Rhodocyclus tenuis]MBK1679845.1 hypothetical protein [Rhodocyclus tenuis]
MLQLLYEDIWILLALLFVLGVLHLAAALRMRRDRKLQLRTRTPRRASQRPDADRRWAVTRRTRMS